jgi:hypothetical protein
MSEATLVCPKCNGEMAQGYVLDRMAGVIVVSTWAPGVPQQSFWTGVQLPPTFEHITIGTFRCQSCGFLESYARKEFAAK